LTKYKVNLYKGGENSIICDEMIEIYKEYIDRAAVLDKFVKNLAKETNEELKGKDAELREIRLVFMSPYKLTDGTYQGFVGMRIKLTAEQKEPEFLNGNDRNSWWQYMLNTAQERFGVGKAYGFGTQLREAVYGECIHASIDFKENSEDEFYSLTPKKEETIREGFRKISEFVEWYYDSVKFYIKSDLRI
jgi:hypothetical protein